MADVTITAARNGPYLVRGPIQLEDADGTELGAGGDVVALCRCGRSANKPFCDGTHGKVGFDGTCARQT